MGIAALVLGIISIIIAFVPLCGVIAFVPAVIGLILGIVDIVKQSKNPEGKKGMGIAGTVLSGIAIVFIAFWLFVVAGLASTAADELNNIDYDYDYSYNLNY